MPFSSHHSLSFESDQESRSLSLNVCALSAADLDAEACMSAIFKLATRAFRRTEATSLSRVEGCGAGMPWLSRNSLRSGNNQCCCLRKSVLTYQTQTMSHRASSQDSLQSLQPSSRLIRSWIEPFEEGCLACGVGELECRACRRKP